MTEPSKIKSEDGYTFYRLNDGRYVDSLLASNLKYCLQFFQLNCGSGTKIIFLNPNIISFSQQSVDQTPWKPYRNTGSELYFSTSHLWGEEIIMKLKTYY
jgi:hypothetical protein